MFGEFGIYLIVFFSVLIFTAAASELVFRRREVGVRLSETATSAGLEESHFSDAAIADLGEAENRLIRRYFEITRRDTNTNSTQNRLIRAGYFSASAVATFQIIRALICIAVLVAASGPSTAFFPNVTDVDPGGRDVCRRHHVHLGQYPYRPAR